MTEDLSQYAWVKLKILSGELQKAIKEKNRNVAGHDEIEWFINSFSKTAFKHRLLSREEEQKLFQELELSPEDKEIREEIIMHNLKLVFSRAKRAKSYRNTGSLKINDLFQEGFFGLLKAIDHFDWHLGYKFSTYATWWIKQAIDRAINDTAYEIRIPIHMRESINKLTKARIELYQELQREPSVEELSLNTGLSAERIQDLYHLISSSKLVSLDKSFEGDDPDERNLLGVLSEGVGVDDEDDPDSGFNLLKKATINEVLGMLDDREREMITNYYGLNGSRSNTLQEVAKIWGRSHDRELTRERVRQILTGALEKLRNNPRTAELLKDFIN